MEPTRVKWLHISDFHFEATDDTFSQQQATQALLVSAQAEAQNGAPTDFVLVTGDVAFSGQEDEYAIAHAFLEELADRIAVPKSRFFFVPGNHDVDRSSQQLAFHGARVQMTSQQVVDQFLGQPTQIAPLQERQAKFWSFVSDFTGDQHRDWTPDHLAYVAPIELNKLKMCVIGLNSVWLSGGDGEEMKLVVGERQFLNAMEISAAHAPLLTLAMAHHPIGWMTEWDGASCRMRLLPAIDFYLRGHLHLHEISLSANPSSPCIEIAAGSGHASRFYDNSYNYCQLDLQSMSCIVREFRYSATDGSYNAHADTTFSLSHKRPLRLAKTELAHSIRLNIPEAEDFADFLAGLLTQHLTEVPVVIDAPTGPTVEFVASAAAPELTSAELAAATRNFLSIANLLAWYQDLTPIDEALQHYAVAVRAYASQLRKIISIDPDSEGRLRSGQGQGKAFTPRMSASWSLELLQDLCKSEDWEELEARSTASLASRSREVADASMRYLIEALMHSDEQTKREQAAELAQGMLKNNHASDDDIVLAAAAAETAGQDEAAQAILVEALSSGRVSERIVSHARSFALRTGDSHLGMLANEKRSGR